MEIDNNNILISKNVLKSLSEIDSFNDEWTSFKKKLKHK